MKNKFLKRIAMAACAFGLLAAVSASSSWAYFTTYVTAQGTAKIDLKYSYTKPYEEEVVNMVKRVKLRNTDVADVWVRVKVFAPSDVLLSIAGENKTNSKWTPGTTDENGYYWYYADILQPGQETQELLTVTITGNKDDVKNKYKLEEKDFNVIVVEECCPVLYESDGTPKTPTEQYWNDSKVEKKKK